MEIRYFKLTGNWNKKHLKKQYRKLASTYHPDKKHGSDDVMQQINAENDWLLKNIGKPIKYYTPPPPKKTPEEYRKEAEDRHKVFFEEFFIEEHLNFLSNWLKQKFYKDYWGYKDNTHYFRIFTQENDIVFLLSFKDWGLRTKDSKVTRVIGKEFNIHVKIEKKWTFHLNRTLLQGRDDRNNMRVCYIDADFTRVIEYCNYKLHIQQRGNK